MKQIEVRGAAIHNLKQIDVSLPKGKFIVFTGVSGSGKSSLAFDILFEEGRKRYLHSIGLHSDTFVRSGEEPFISIMGLPPAIAVEQRTLRQTNPRSFVGTRTKLLDALKWLFSTEGLGPDGKRTSLLVEAFSFHHPEGMCLACYGRGVTTFLDEKRVVSDPRKRLEQICIEGGEFGRQLVKRLPDFATHYGYDWKSLTFDQLKEEERHAFLHGIEGKFIGYIPYIYSKLTTPRRKVQFEHLFASRVTCETCGGFRLSTPALNVFIDGKHLGELNAMPFSELAPFFKTLDMSGFSEEGRHIVDQILWKLKLLEEVGLSYLNILRTIPSLSGGELQRLFLMHHLQSEFDSLLYIFDEPTAGLHEAEKQALVGKLRSLTEAGNTVIVVEHDSNVIRSSDYVVEFGPAAGIHGGNILFQGPVTEYPKANKSVLAPYLWGKRRLPSKSDSGYRSAKQDGPKLVVRNAGLHNLRQVDVAIPLGAMVGVAGKSGSGKSTLISGTLVPLLEHHLSIAKESEVEEMEEGGALTGSLGWLEGSEAIAECVVVTQAPIGRNRMSTPITYIEIWDKVRELFANQPLAVERGYTPGHFSFNTDYGACPQCNGDGSDSLDMGPIGVYERSCPVCKGTRYKSEILEVNYNGQNIHDVLSMSVEHACQLFADHKAILPGLDIMLRVGLGYLSLGQPAPTLSGGEAQRLKLAKALGKQRKSGALYVLDEPTTGLGATDIERLMLLLDELVEQGNTVIVTEHEPHLLSYCDWLIEMGPGGGNEGGRIIAEGSPQDLAKNPDSIIGPYLVGGFTAMVSSH
ncbi:excinuclease ABC subunit UvrA [Paenibacillus alkalitolerans]|uniref:excinuclease ABC subunit UvrA n=1 Tax=Paenibacillus alkalitolerans TaxID=2799335 RepID=UPI0018F311D7|nr:excinuclease ABC subunit UvrA [Paenibacillus alkalitolerans]